MWKPLPWKPLLWKPLLLALCVAGLASAQMGCGGDDDGPANVSPRADCMVTPDSIHFGEVCVGDVSGVSQFTISAPASNTESVTGSVGSSCADFTVVSGGGAFTLNPGDSKNVSIRFAPSSADSSWCSITTGSACPDVPVVGIGRECLTDCELNPGRLLFGNVDVGQTRTLSFTILAPATNGKAISGGVSAPCDDYTITAGGGAFTLNPGEQRLVTVDFHPQSTGVKRCTIQLGTDCGIMPTTGQGI